MLIVHRDAGLFTGFRRSLPRGDRVALSLLRPPRSPCVAPGSSARAGRATRRKAATTVSGAESGVALMLSMCFIFGARLAASPAPPWRDDPDFASAPVGAGRQTRGVENAFFHHGPEVEGSKATGLEVVAHVCDGKGMSATICDSRRAARELAGRKRLSASEWYAEELRSKAWSIKITAATRIPSIRIG